MVFSSIMFREDLPIVNNNNDNIKSLKCPKNFRRHYANVDFLDIYIFCNYNIIVLIFLTNLNFNL